MRLDGLPLTCDTGTLYVQFLDLDRDIWSGLTGATRLADGEWAIDDPLTPGRYELAVHTMGCIGPAYDVFPLDRTLVVAAP